MTKRWRKGTTVELTRNWKDAGLKKGAIGRVVKSRKERDIDAYWYEVRFDKFTGDWPLRVHQYSLERGRHRIRVFRHETQTWHCQVCGRKVKAPKPCPVCRGYGFPKRKSKGTSTPFFFTYAGQRVCAFCEARLPRERKTDGHGNPLHKGDVVSITGGPIEYMGLVGKRARVLRLNKQRVTIEFADGTEALWNYRFLAESDQEPTDPGDLESGREMAEALNRVFGEAL